MSFGDDPLLRKLDRLMRQMERGELLDEDPMDTKERSPQNKRKKRRRNGNGNKSFQNWNNNTTSSNLKEYDALRDPHCRFTKKKQFKKQYEHYARAQMISDVLRGDHASLLDVVQDRKSSKHRNNNNNSNSPRQQNSKNAPRRKRNTKRRDQSGYGVPASKKNRNKTNKKLPGINRSRNQNQNQNTTSDYRDRHERSPGIPNIPVPRATQLQLQQQRSLRSREEDSGRPPPLPSVLPGGGSNRRRTGKQDRHGNHNNESWKRVGGSTSVNDAVLKYRNKGNKKKTKRRTSKRSDAGSNRSHSDRVHLDYQKKRRENHRYSTKVRQHAYQNVNLPPMPNELSPNGGQAAFRRTDRMERGKQHRMMKEDTANQNGRNAAEPDQPQVDSPPSKETNINQSSPVALPPSAMMERPDGVVANMMGGEDLGMSRRQRGQRNDTNDGMGSMGSMGMLGMNEEDMGNHFDVSSMFDNTEKGKEESKATMSSTFFEAPIDSIDSKNSKDSKNSIDSKDRQQNITDVNGAANTAASPKPIQPNNIPTPNSPLSPGGGDDYSDDDFDDDEFEDEEVETPKETTKPTTESTPKSTSDSIKKLSQQPTSIEAPPTPVLPPIELKDVEDSISSRFRGTVSQLIYNLIFNQKYNPTLLDLQSLNEKIGTFSSDQRTVTTSITNILQPYRKTHAVRIQTKRNIGRVLDLGLSTTVKELNNAVGHTESDIKSQKKALFRILTTKETKQSFDVIKIPMLIIKALHEQEEQAKKEQPTQQEEDDDQNNQNDQHSICTSLDSLLRTTANALLRHDADASGEERCNDFITLLGNRPLLFPSTTSTTPATTAMQGLQLFTSFLAPSTKGILISLLWQSCHGSSLPGARDTPGAGSGTQRMRLEVGRNTALQDSYTWASTAEPQTWVPFQKNLRVDTVWDRRLSSQLLFPYFKRNEISTNGEIADGGLEEGEGSGPRKEFFSTVGMQLVNSLQGKDQTKEKGLFVYVKANELYWLASSNAPSTGEMYRWIGMLMGCALTSRCHFGIHLPTYLFRCLLSNTNATVPNVSMQEAKEISPEIVNGLKTLKQMDMKTFQQYVEMEGGDTSLSKQQYFANELKERIVDPVRNSLEELRVGFQSIVSTSWSTTVNLSPSDLKMLICGNLSNPSDPFHLKDLFHIQTDNDVSENPELLNCFYKIVKEFDPVYKRQFLKFVTGINKLPLPFSETIHIHSPFMCFSEQEHRINVQRLPTAHTCFNTLEIPNYCTSLLELNYEGQTLNALNENERDIFVEQLMEHMKQKLRLAIDCSDGSGYGLDEGVSQRNELTSTTGSTRNEGGSGSGSNNNINLNNNNNFDDDEKNENLSMQRTPSVTIVRDIQSTNKVEVKEVTPREETPREETPRGLFDSDSDGSLDIPGLSDTDDDLDDLFDGFD